MGAIRNTIFSLHKWFGLISAFFFAFMFLTGGLLSVSDTLIWLAKPTLRTEPVGPHASVGAVYEAALKSVPGASVFVIERMQDQALGDKVYIAGGGYGSVIVNVDPYTLHIQDIDVEPRAITAIKNLHKDLYVPKGIGHFLISGTSLVLLYAVVSGLITYRRFWKGLFRFPSAQGTPRAFWGMAHRLIALWSVPFLLVIGLTASFYFMEDLRIAGQPPDLPVLTEREATRPEGFDGATLDAMIADIRRDFPQFEAKTIVLPADRDQPVTMAGYVSDRQLLGPHTFVFDPSDLKRAAHWLPTEGTGLTRYRELLTALHYGHWAGMLSQVLWLIFAALAIALIWAGLNVHARRTAPQSHGTLRAAWQSLGIFRWAYVAAVLCTAALAILR